MSGFRIVLALWMAVAAQAESAVLECIHEAAGRGFVTLEFRTAAIQGWRIEKATLMLHPATPRLPKRVGISAAPAPKRWKSAMATDYGEGWIELTVPPELVGEIASGRARGLAVRGVQPDSRRTVAYAPYLLVEGARRQLR